MKKDFFLRNKWVLIGGIVGICLMIPLIQKWNIPELLRDSRNSDEKAIRFEMNDTKAVIFYPKNTEKEFVSTMTSFIKDDLSSQVIETTQLKVDYHKYEMNELLFLCFDVVDEQENLVGVYSSICDRNTHTEVQVADLVQESFYDYVSSELRYQTKETGVLGDLAYSNEFYQQTSKEAVKNVQLYLDAEQVQFYLKMTLDNQVVVLHASVPKEKVSPYFIEEHVLYEKNSVTHPLRHYVDKERPMVAITFDDGPLKKNTTLAMDLLKEVDGRSTFFMLGNRMERNPDVVLSAVNQGHEIASHSYDHPYLTKKNTNLEFQYNRNQEILSEITGGEAQIHLLRPPYGSMNQKVKETSPYPLILWSVDTEDWKKQDATLIYEYIMETVQDGDVLLLHDLHEFSVESLRMVLPALTDAGYQVVTVSELMEAREIELQKGISYSKARKTSE